MSNSTIPDNQNFQVSLKLMIKNERGETLLLTMPQHSPTANYYDFPGGRISEAERDLPLPETIKREINEELGSNFKYRLLTTKPVAVTRSSYFSRRWQKEIFVFWIFFEAEYLNGDIVISDEHDHPDWVKLTPDNLTEYLTHGPLAGARNYFGLD